MSPEHPKDAKSLRALLDQYERYRQGERSYEEFTQRLRRLAKASQKRRSSATESAERESERKPVTNQ